MKRALKRGDIVSSFFEPWTCACFMNLFLNWDQLKCEDETWPSDGKLAVPANVQRKICREHSTPQSLWPTEETYIEHNSAIHSRDSHQHNYCRSIFWNLHHVSSEPRGGLYGLNINKVMIRI